LKKKIAV